MEINSQSKKDYAERKLEGIMQTNRKKSPFAKNRSFERMMAKIKKEKPDINGTKVNWGKKKKNTSNVVDSKARATNNE